MAQLPCFRAGDARASAALTEAATTPMAVYGRRVQHALTDAAPRRANVACCGTDSGEVAAKVRRKKKSRTGHKTPTATRHTAIQRAP